MMKSAQQDKAHAPLAVGASPDAWGWVIRWSPFACRVIAYLVALLVAAPFVYHLARGSIAYLGLFEDDYFYYAIVADKLATLGKLTYDGATITNGFHPLWFVVVFILRLIAGGLNGAFYTMLAGTFAASSIATYELSRAFARSLGASTALAAALPLVYCVPTDLLLSSGMETALDIPLLLWLLLELSSSDPITPRRAARLGFVSSLAILARLDLALVVAIYTVGWIWATRPPWSQASRAAVAFGAAGLAVPVYAVGNLALCGSVLPVSALAKQLVAKRGVNLSYLRVMAFSTPFGHFAGILMVLGVAALLAMSGSHPRVKAAAKPEALFAAATILGFTALFIGLNTLSGWCYFAWYAYPLAPSLVAALALVGAVVASRIATSWRTRASAAAVVLASGLGLTQGVYTFVTRGPLWSVEDNALLAMSVDLADRMHDRHGVFAMGAVGGFATYMLGKPVVQIEGLAADRAMVEHIRGEDDLGTVLSEYDVDYLIVSLHRATMPSHDGCYTITQPNAEWSGDRVKRMRGELCAEPIAHFPTHLPARPWSQFSTLDTYVFALRGARWGGRERDAHASTTGTK
jgi:hypothetical protein